MEERMRKRPKVDLSEAEVKLAVKILKRTREIFSFFKFLKEKKDSPFAMVLIRSESLKKSILKEKRKSDVYVNLKIPDMHLIFLPDIKIEEGHGFIDRMMSGIKDDSGDFASVVEVKKNADLEETVFTLLADHLILLKQSIEWRTGQISYKEV